MKKKKPIPTKESTQEAQVKDFFDLISPSTIKFNADHYIVGDSYRSVWAVREYPPTTTDQALLSRFGDKEAVTLHGYSHFVDNAEQRKIIQNATRKNRMMTGGTDIQDTVTAEKLPSLTAKQPSWRSAKHKSGLYRTNKLGVYSYYLSSPLFLVSC